MQISVQISVQGVQTMASVQVVQNQSDPADTSLDTQPKEQDEIKKIC